MTTAIKCHQSEQVSDGVRETNDCSKQEEKGAVPFQFAIRHNNEKYTDNKKELDAELVFPVTV